MAPRLLEEEIIFVDDDDDDDNDVSSFHNDDDDHDMVLPAWPSEWAPDHLWSRPTLRDKASDTDPNRIDACPSKNRATATTASWTRQIPVVDAGEDDDDDDNSQIDDPPPALFEDWILEQLATVLFDYQSLLLGPIFRCGTTADAAAPARGGGITTSNVTLSSSSPPARGGKSAAKNSNVPPSSIRIGTKLRPDRHNDDHPRHRFSRLKILLPNRRCRSRKGGDKGAEEELAATRSIAREEGEAAGGVVVVSDGSGGGERHHAPKATEDIATASSRGLQLLAQSSSSSVSSSSVSSMSSLSYLPPSAPNKKEKEKTTTTSKSKLKLKTKLKTETKQTTGKEVSVIGTSPASSHPDDPKSHNEKRYSSRLKTAMQRVLFRRTTSDNNSTSRSNSGTPNNRWTRQSYATLTDNNKNSGGTVAPSGIRRNIITSTSVSNLPIAERSEATDLKATKFVSSNNSSSSSSSTNKKDPNHGCDAESHTSNDNDNKASCQRGGDKISIENHDADVVPSSSLHTVSIAAVDQSSNEDQLVPASSHHSSRPPLSHRDCSPSSKRSNNHSTPQSVPFSSIEAEKKHLLHCRRGRLPNRGSRTTAATPSSTYSSATTTTATTTTISNAAAAADTSATNNHIRRTTVKTKTKTVRIAGSGKSRQACPSSWPVYKKKKAVTIRLALPRFPLVQPRPREYRRYHEMRDDDCDDDVYEEGRNHTVIHNGDVGIDEDCVCERAATTPHYYSHPTVGCTDHHHHHHHHQYVPPRNNSSGVEGCSLTTTSQRRRSRRTDDDAKKKKKMRWWQKQLRPVPAVNE